MPDKDREASFQEAGRQFISRQAAHWLAVNAAIDAIDMGIPPKWRWIKRRRHLKRMREWSAAWAKAPIHGVHVTTYPEGELPADE